jgi:hypothetical protein
MIRELTICCILIVSTLAAIDNDIMKTIPVPILKLRDFPKISSREFGPATSTLIIAPENYITSSSNQPITTEQIHLLHFGSTEGLDAHHY